MVSAHVQEQGCRLECVLLKSSGVHGSGYFDTSVTKVHTINEGQSCDTEVVSILLLAWNFCRCFSFRRHQKVGKTHQTVSIIVKEIPLRLQGKQLIAISIIIGERIEISKTKI